MIEKPRRIKQVIVIVLTFTEPTLNADAVTEGRAVCVRLAIIKSNANHIPFQTVRGHCNTDSTNDEFSARVAVSSDTASVSGGKMHVLMQWLVPAPVS